MVLAGTICVAHHQHVRDPRDRPGAFSRPRPTRGDARPRAGGLMLGHPQPRAVRRGGEVRAAAVARTPRRHGRHPGRRITRTSHVRGARPTNCARHRAFGQLTTQIREARRAAGGRARLAARTQDRRSACSTSRRRSRAPASPTRSSTLAHFLQHRAEPRRHRDRLARARRDPPTHLKAAVPGIDPAPASARSARWTPRCARACGRTSRGLPPGRLAGALRDRRVHAAAAGRTRPTASPSTSAARCRCSSTCCCRRSRPGPTSSSSSSRRPT